MIRITLVSNAIQLEAARRLRRQVVGADAVGADPGRVATDRADPAGPEALVAAAARVDAVRPVAPVDAGAVAVADASHRRGRLEPRFELLVHEPGRMRLTAEDRRLWPLRCPVSPALMAALTLPALLGLVSELRLSHLCRVGRALRLLARHAGSLCLLDDGLDQYRAQPRAVQPEAFAAGTPCWLFSDAPAFRADWCRRFHCRELGPLYAPPAGAVPGEASGAAAPTGTLIIDSPGVERLQSRAGELPSPWCLVPHPVAVKRSWRLALRPGDRLLRRPPEQLLADWNGVVVVGESLVLLAAVRLRPAGAPLWIALPESVDGNLAALARSLAARDAAITLW